jgi:hypothetical protein
MKQRSASLGIGIERGANDRNSHVFSSHAHFV